MAQNATIYLDRQDTKDFLSLLSLHDRTAAGRRLSPKITEIMDAIARDGALTIDLAYRPEVPAWAIEQPLDVVAGQALFPLRYPSGFGHFPICLAFWSSPLRSYLLSQGHTNLNDLGEVSIEDVLHLDGTIEEQVVATRKRVDAILAEKPIPEGGYRMLPVSLTLNQSAVSVAEAISNYLPFSRRAIFRLALNVDGDAISLAEVARSRDVSITTPKDIIRDTFFNLACQYDWRPSYEGLTAQNGTASEIWLDGIHPNLRRHFGLIRSLRKPIESDTNQADRHIITAELDAPFD